MADRIPLEIFYIKVAQKLGGNASPTMARKYGEAIQDVLYEELLTNEECYWYGFGNFETLISKRSAKYSETTNFGCDNRREMKYIEPKLLLKFKPANPLMEGLREGAEKLRRPNITHKRKYKNINEYNSEYNKRRRKKRPSNHKIIDGWIADARYGAENDIDDIEEEENGEEGYNED